MKKQSQFLKISILFIMVLIIMGIFSNVVLAAKEVPITDGVAKIELTWDLKGYDSLEEQIIRVRTGEEIRFLFTHEGQDVDVYSGSVNWNYKEGTGVNILNPDDPTNLDSIMKVETINPKATGSCSYYITATTKKEGWFGWDYAGWSYSARVRIEVEEPKLHIYSSSNNYSNIKEDVNNDGLVTSYDIMEANKHKGETVSSSNSKYDLDGNKKIDDTDIKIIEQVSSNITNKTVHKNLIFPGDKINLKIFEQPTSQYQGRDIEMSDLEYTAKIGKANGNLNTFTNFNDLKIKINGTTGTLEIPENVNFNNCDILALNFKIKEKDSWIRENLDFIENWINKVVRLTFNKDLTVNEDGCVYNANAKTRSLRTEVATIYFYVGGIKSNATWKYKINANNTVDIVKYLGSATEIAIPETIDGISVSKISAGAFSSTNVTKITIGANITAIDEGAFTNATKLQKIEVNTNNSKYWSGAAGHKDEGVLYEYIKSGDKKYCIGIIKYPEAKTGNEYVINIYDGTITDNYTKYIAKEAFYNTKLIKIGMPDNISQIKEGAFKNSKNLTTIENTDNTIKGLDSTQLESQRKSKQLSNSLTYIGKEAFNGCSSLERIRIPNTNAQNKIFGKEINKNNAKDLKNLKIFTNVKNVEYYKDDNSMEYYVRKSTENYIANIAAGKETNFILVGKNNGTIEYWENTKSNMICVNKGLTYNLELERDKTYSYMGFMQFGDVQTIDLVNIGSQYKVDTNHTTTNYDQYVEITKLGDNKIGIKIKANLPNGAIKVRMAYEVYEGAKLSDTYYFDLYITEGTDTWRGIRLAKSENGKLKVVGDGTAIYRWEAVNSKYNYDTYNNATIDLTKDALTLAGQAGRKQIINDSLQFVLVDSNNVIQPDVTWAVSSSDARYVFDSQKNEGFNASTPGLLNLAPFTKEITTDMLKSEGKYRKITLTITATKDGKTYTFGKLYIMPRTIKNNENTYYILDDEYNDETNWHNYVELIRMEPKTGETTLTVPVWLQDSSVDANGKKGSFVVRNIATRAIRPNSSITKVNIQNTTDENLRKNNAVKTLGWGVIAENSSVKEILIGEDVNLLSANFATLCSGLEKYTVDSANATFMSKDGVIYSDKGTTLYAYPQAKPGAVFTVPETVTTIGWYAFNKNKTLTKLSLPDGLKNLKRYSLVNMYNVTNIFIPSNVEIIGDLGWRNINKKAEADIAAYLKECYIVGETDDNVMGHVFDRDDGKKYNVYFDASNKISKDYAYYFGDYKLSGAERPTYINDITGGKPEANFKTATVASANLYNKQPISKNYYVGENVNNDIKDLQLEVTYMDENKTLLDKVIVNVPSDRIIYQKPEWAFFTKFYEPTTKPITLYVNYEGVRSSPIVNANVTIGPLEVDSSKLTTKRFLANSNLEYVKEMLVVNKVNSDGTKTKLANNQYTLELGKAGENKIIVKYKDNPEQNDGVAPRTANITGVTIYSKDQVETFTNIAEADYKVLKEKLANNIIHYDDATRTIVIPKEDIKDKLSVELTKNPDKKIYTKGKQGDENVSLEGAEIVVKYILPGEPTDFEYVMGTRGSESISLDNNNIAEILELAVGTADIKEQTKLSLKPNYNGIELSEFDIIVEPAEIESIYVAETFVKKEYLDGQKFEKSGFKLMANYAGEVADGEIKEGYTLKIGETELIDGETEIKPINNSTTAKYKVSAEYLGKVVNVCNIEVKERIVTEIEITKTDKNFVEGQDVTKNNDILVNITYSDGTQEEISGDEVKENFIVEPEILSAGDTEFTIKYKDNTQISQTITGITVAAKKITKVEVLTWENMPEQNVANVNWEGAKIKITYNDGTQETLAIKDNLNNENLVIENFDQNKQGVYNVAVSYKGVKSQNTWEINLIEKVKEIQIDNYPKTEYLQDSDIDLSAGTIKVVYEREEAKPEIISMTDSRVVVEGIGEKATESKELTVKYDGKETKFWIIVIAKEDIEFTNLEIVNKPYKTEYKVGEELDLSGGKVKLTYKNKENLNIKTDVIDMTNDDILLIDSSSITDENLAGTYVVKVKLYDNESLEDEFTVEYCNKVVQSLIVINEGMQQEYLAGEKLNKNGLKVALKYDNGTSSLISDLDKINEMFIVHPEELTQEDDGKNITVVYRKNQNISATIEGLKLKVIPITSITITEEPRAKYIQGERLDLTTGAIEVKYSNEQTVNKKLSEISDKVIGFNGNKVGKQTIAVNYGGAQTTFEVEVIAKEFVTDVSIENMPKTKYELGNELDLSDGKLKVQYIAGSKLEEIVIPMESGAAVVKQADLETEGNKVVILECAGHEVEFEITVEDKQIDTIEIKTEPSDKKYLEGQTFNPAGMVVVAKNKAGKEIKTLRAKEYSYSQEPLVKGFAQEIEVKYKENELITTKIAGIDVYGQDEVKEFTIPMVDYTEIKDSIADKIITKEELTNGNVRLVLVPDEVSIEVKAIYDKEYNVGDSLDLSNYKVIVNYGEGESKLKLTEITLDESMLKTETTFTKEQAGTAVEVTIDYLGAQTSFKVNVSKEQDTDSISLGSLKTQTIENETYLRIEDMKMTVEELKQIIKNANRDLDLEIEVLDNEGNVIADTEVFTTGMIIKISSDTETKEFILAKVGYINSDNKLAITDLIKLLNHLAEERADNPNPEKILRGAYWVAADITGDGKVNMFDIIPLVNLINNL